MQTEADQAAKAAVHFVFADKPASHSRSSSADDRAPNGILQIFDVRPLRRLDESLLANDGYPTDDDAVDDHL
jgi:hypothetical protein